MPQEPHLVCLHEERWLQMAKEIVDTKTLIQDIHDKLFIGNGTPPLTMRVDRVERFLFAIGTAIGTVILAGLVGGATVLFNHMFKVTQ